MPRAPVFYAGIGSRETPQHILNWMEQIAIFLERYGLILNSGGADGADHAFEKGVQNPTQKQIFLPWLGYNGRTYGPGVYELEPVYAQQALRIAEQYHPAWDRCSRGARSLHSRNVPIVMGPTLQETVCMVICWTKDGKASGGTGQALRIAEHLDIPIMNLFHYGSLEEALIDLASYVTALGCKLS